MNRFIKVVAVLAVVLSSTVLSASAKIPFLMYGVSAGTNVSSFKLLDAADTSLGESQFGYQAGAMVGLDLPIIELSAEALWVHNKMTFSDYDTSSITSNSIELPILASIPILGPIRLKAGPSFMIYNNAKANYDDGYEDLGSVKSTVGYVVGLGLKITKITFDLRYNGQFKKDTAFGIENTTSEYDMNASSFSASIGYRF
ncbi:MAG: outer membrane beta-barrel protein [Rikenellaceae bacterium]